MIVATVFNQFVKEQGFFSRSASLVLQNIINSVILFANDYFQMFSFSHKSLSPCILIHHNISKCITPPPTSTPITMRDTIIETTGIHHIPRSIRGHQKVNNICKTEKLIKQLFEKKVYNPTNLDLQDLCKEDEEAIRYILHIIHYRHCIEAIPKEAFVPLKAAYLRRQIPGWNTIKQGLLRAGIIETDHFYIEGQKCFGYRAGERFRASPYRLVTIKTNIPKESNDDNAFATPVCTWLKRQAQRIAVANDETTDQLQIIRDGLWRFNSRDTFGWRFHSNLTRLKTEARRALRVNGKPLAEIDIKNSQPLFLAKLLKERGVVGCEKYIEICQQDLYAYIAAKAGLTRAEAKAAIIETVFFARLGARHAIKTQFKREFPEVWRFIEGVKKKDFRKLARLLQRTEAQFVIYTVCERIRKERPEMFVATIHDSILHRPMDSAYVRAVLDAEFANWGLKPRLEITNYGD